MKTVLELKNILEPLTWLIGEWYGEGNGGFPTHDAFEYVDYMHFKIVGDAFENEPIIHFEEMARVNENSKFQFKHWETGYFKPASNGRIEFYTCHNTGRVEITYGTYEELDLKRRSFQILFKSDSIRNDEGTKTALESRRELTYKDGVISYRLAMSTTEVPELTNHLEAKLRNV